MRTQKLKDLAKQVGQVPVDDLAEFIDLIFDAVIEGKSKEELLWIRALLREIGVNVSEICKRKSR